MGGITKAELRKFRRDRVYCRELRERLEKIEADMVGLKGPRIDGLPHGGTSSAEDRIIDGIAQKERLKKAYGKKIARFLAEQARIEAAISVLPLREQELIRLYYFDGLKWSEVAEAMNYSVPQIFRLHGKAILKLSAKNSSGSDEAQTHKT